MTVATFQEALYEWADNAGMDRPDEEYLLHPNDFWMKNPHYTGKPGRHPEDWSDDGEF